MEGFNRGGLRWVTDDGGDPVPFLCERFGDYLGDFSVAWDWGRLISERTLWRRAV